MRLHSLTDQIEFANVILLNKTDMVPKEQIGSIENLVRTLNPAAKIIRTTYSKVDLKELLSENSTFLELPWLD
jgi:G3E family GTPase